jgi:hypothetical protein
MKIAIDKDSILDDVKMTVSVIVRDEVDGQGNSLYPIVMPTSRDDKMLTLLYNDGMNSLLSAVNTLNPTLDGGEIELTKADIEDASVGLLQSLARSFLKDGITGAWLKLKGSAMYQPFIDSSIALLSDFKRKAYLRKTP